MAAGHDVIFIGVEATARVAEEVVDFSVDFLCAKLLKHAEAGVPHDEVTFGLEEAIIDHFGLPNSVQTRRLAHPAYHVFLKNYALRGSYPYKDGNPVPETHYWRLRNGFPDSDKFKVEVLKEYSYIP